MTLALDKDTLLGAIAVVSGVGFAIKFTVFHFRVLRIMRSLLSRLPLALADGILRDATDDEKVITSKRGSQRFSCQLFVRKEHFNEKFDVAVDRYQQASAYPLKSRVSIVAIALWLFFAVFLGVYFLRDRGLAQDNNLPVGGVAAVSTNPPPTSVTDTNAASRTASQPTPPVQAAALTNPTDRDKAAELIVRTALVFLAISAGFALFAVSLVVCYHYGVFGVLVEEVISLSENVGLVAIKSSPDGTPQIDKIVPAKDDADFNALLRLTKNDK